MIVVTKKGRMKYAKVLQGIAPSPGAILRLRLFTNGALTPTPSSVVGDFVQATFGGYAEIVFPYGSATGPTLVGNQAIVRVSGSPQVWFCTSAPQTIYGWYLFDDVEGDVVLCEKYDTPAVLTAPGTHTLYLDVSTGKWVTD